jgi:hypothetical protein
MRTIRYTAAVAAAGLVLGIAGCGDQNAKQLADMNKSNIQRLGNLYAAFQNQKNNRGPKDEAEFKEFIKEYDPNKLKTMGVDAGNVDAVFVSERDGQPFKIRYKVGGGRGSSDAVIFEQAGKDGKKQVGYTGGKIEDVDDATYAQLWAPKGKPKGGPAEQGGRGRGGRPEGAPVGPDGK